MDKRIVHLRKEWKAYVMAIWMIGVVMFLFHLQGRIAMLQKTCQKIMSSVDSTESILISTDQNVAHIKAQVDEMVPKIDNVHSRVMRR